MSQIERTPILASSSPALAAAIVELARGGPFAVADARYGTWSPQSLATQWIGQIVGEDVVLSGDAPVSGSPNWLNDAIAGGIDEEGRGNRALLAAFKAARQLTRLLHLRPTRLILLAPISGSFWLRESELLLGYLEAMSGAQVAVLQTDPGAPPFFRENLQDVTAALASNRAMNADPCTAISAMPTTLSPRVRSLFKERDENALLTLANGWAVVTPEARRAGTFTFARSALREFDQPGLALWRGFAMYHADREESNAMQAAVEAWRFCYNGPRELAPVLMDEAVSRAQGVDERGVLRAQRQALRVITSKFADAATEPPPEDGMSGAAASAIEEGRGWGLVMTGRPDDARDALRRARALRSQPVLDRAALLLMNISALAELRTGNSDTALELEKAIELALEHVPDCDDLRFVNNINQARLYRYLGDFPQSRGYYGRAFATAEGGRTDNDQVNANLCFSRLALAEGDSESALACWVRAAMQWCANNCREALNWRVQMLVIDKARQIEVASFAEAEQLVEALAQGFLRELETLARENGVALVPDPQDAVPFAVSEATTKLSSPPRLLGADGWSVLAAEVPQTPRSAGANLRRLEAWLTAWIRRAAPRGGETCFLIDRRDGGEMPTDRISAWGSAIDHGASRVEFEVKSTDLDVPTARSIQLSRFVTLSPFVSRIDGDGASVVHFRRYQRPFVLSAVQRTLIARVSEGVTLGELMQEYPSAEKDLAQLRCRRVLRLGPLSQRDIESLGDIRGTASGEVGLDVQVG